MLLQFHGTPWLGKRWTNVDMSFEKSLDRPRSILIGRPFIQKQFRNPSCYSTPSYVDGAKGSSEVPNESTFALGLALTELWFGKPIDHLRGSLNPSSSGEEHSITDFATSKELLEQIYKDAGAWYGDAVSQCIRCDFRQRSDSLESEALKEAVHRMVLFPLEQNLSAFCGGNLEAALR